VEADVVIVSTGAPNYVLTRDLVHSAMKARRHRSLCLIDLAVPRNVDPATGGLSDVYAYDVDDLEKVVETTHEARRGEALRAEAIIEAEVMAFAKERETRAALPVLAQLRRQAESIARAEAERTLAHVGAKLDDKGRRSVEAMAQAIVNKLLHGPTARLKEAASSPAPPRSCSASRKTPPPPRRAQASPGRRRAAPPRARPATSERQDDTMIRIATRRSPLAKWQANHVSDLLRRNEPGLEVRLHEVVTKGDRILDVPLADVGGKGLFVKEIEDALLAGDAEVAVHSMKDLPAELAEGLVIAAVPEREDPRDALCSPRYRTLDGLPRGARVGTSSLRRSAQLKAMRPDLEIQVVRGNVETRLRKASEGLDAVVLAYAGLRRLGLAQHATQVFSPEEMLPAVAQGALALEARAADAATLGRLAALEHPETRVRTEAERGFLGRIEGGCQVPIAGHATVEGDRVRLRALVASLDGARVIRAERSGPFADARRMGAAVAEELLAKGADAILRECEGKLAGMAAPRR
jgi:hydroxymethylbilane synthase